MNKMHIWLWRTLATAASGYGGPENKQIRTGAPLD